MDVKTNTFDLFEDCEALGEDGKWYFARIIKQQVDGTYDLELKEFPPNAWGNVPSHNLRKLDGVKLPRDKSNDDFAEPTGTIPKKARKVMFDETFTEFDEKPPQDCGTSSAPRSSVVRFSVTEKRSVKDELSIQVDHVLEDYRKIHRALSSIGSEFSEAETKTEAKTVDGKLKVTITCTREETAERKLTILLPESPAHACYNPFSWFFKTRRVSAKRMKNSNMYARREKVKMTLKETLEDDVRRGSNLYHGKKQAWTKEDQQIYQNEIEAEINRLRNASSIALSRKATSSRLRAESYNPRCSDTSFADAYMSLSRFRLLSDSGTDLPDVKSNRPENVVWLSDGTMIKAENRIRGDTYFLEDPTLKPGALSYTKRLQLSNQWDVDSTMISSTWSNGDKVEVWLGVGWQPAIIQDCIVEDNLSKLLVSCHQSEENSTHTVKRYGKHIRPWGYLEPDSDDESDSENSHMI